MRRSSRDSPTGPIIVKGEWNHDDLVDMVRAEEKSSDTAFVPSQRHLAGQHLLASAGTLVTACDISQTGEISPAPREPQLNSDRSWPIKKDRLVSESFARNVSAHRSMSFRAMRSNIDRKRA